MQKLGLNRAIYMSVLILVCLLIVCIRIYSTLLRY
jgi:hypothetical protein